MSLAEAGGGGAASDDDDTPLVMPKTQPNGGESNGQIGAKDAEERPAKKAKPAVDEDSDDDDAPLSMVKAASTPTATAGSGDDSDDDKPLHKLPVKLPSAKKEQSRPAKRSAPADDESSDDEPITAMKVSASPKAKKAKKEKKEKKDKKDKKEKKAKKEKRETSSQPPTPRKSKKKEEEEEEEEEIYRWWEEEELPDGQKWRTLEHKGPLFPPEYIPLPRTVHLMYDGKPFHLSPAAEEIAGFYATMLNTDYVTKPVFNKNFWEGWTEHMTKEERAVIKDLEKCDFTKIQAHYQALSEAKKNSTKEEKEARKAAEAKLRAEYGYAILDGHKQKVGNFRLEPPGLFRGRGEHPKMGVLKKRLQPEDIIINIGDKSKAPVPPEGHQWKEVRSDNSVTWMASWTENVQAQCKYIMFNAESYLKGRNDLKKYETARELKKCVDKIRRDYTADLKNKVMLDRQRATALYFIDKLALRAGGEKDTDEQADTVGCCNLRVEHVTCLPDLKIQFDFLGKDSIQYLNVVEVSPQVYKNVQIFQRAKEPGDDLFDRLTVPMLNTYLNSLMPGLTAKVFRTYNASVCLQEQLRSTPVDGSVELKMLAYNKANKEVAILCNHQRAVPKGHGGQVEKLDGELEAIQKELKSAKKAKKAAKSEGNQKDIAKYSKKIETLKARLHKKEIQRETKEELKTIALGTSKLNYLDPRISVAWSMNHDVPIEKVYNATQRAKFRWAIEMTKPDFVF